MNYPSLRIEGAILSPDILDRLEDLPGQKPQDFGLESSAKVKDEIARAWADAQDYWRIFQRKLEGVKGESPATTETRQLWVGPLLGLLGYQLEYQARGTELHGKLYSISHRAANRANAPVQIVGYREPAGLDRKPERTNIRMSAHAVVQEFINLNDQLYGLVTNGRLLRLLRDSSRLIRLSYVEFDLDRMFGEALYADFAVMYRLLHATRLPVGHEAAAESWIERYHQDSLDSGARIRDGLSRAVEQAIRSFGNGFLAHPANDALRAAVAAKDVTAAEYYQILLRLIYRLLFLMVIEERDLVFPSVVPGRKRDVYRDFYSVQRLRALSEKRYLADGRRHDLWAGLLSTFRLFEAGGPGTKLGIAPLAGDLFSGDAIGPLADSRLGNDVLLGCLRSLSLYTHPETGQIIRVNYGALNVEEFGSVYEGLLEYEPILVGEVARPEFGFKAGDERSRTGSHYTPDDLVQPLIKHSLDHLIDERLKAPNPEQALLDLRVADISCGSGHILLAAARRIATELAIVRTGEEQPSPSAYRAALRDVIRSCIYGVDLNPLAVELCKVALWLEAHNPGQPLNFLDHHIKCGNSIVGFVRREELERGVPDEAFATLPGDEKEAAAVFRKKNRAERLARQQIALKLGLAVGDQLSQGPALGLLKRIADLPVSQFFVPKLSANRDRIVTEAEFDSYWTGQANPNGQGVAEARRVSEERRFFHWFLEFPEIIERGGFDCLLGNPPYLGGKKISGTYGDPFLAWLKWHFAPAGGLSDLVVYFLRRLASLVRPDGFYALISTNTVSQGDSREGGLQFVTTGGHQITFARKSVRWPGAATLEVSLLALRAGAWSSARVLGDMAVSHISALLEAAEDEVGPARLAENDGVSYIGSVILGTGFLLTEERASQLISMREANGQVLMPYLSGADLNSHPQQHPSRWAINFRAMSLEDAQTFVEPFDIVDRLVRPQRERVKRKVYRERWWQYAEKCEALYRAIAGRRRVLVVAQTSKTLAFALVPSTYVFAMMTVVFNLDGFDDFAVFQSSLHNVWAWKYASTLKSDLRYVPTDIAQTFARPRVHVESGRQILTGIGERYHEHRKSLMVALWLGLTDMYNLFHSRDLSPEQVAKVCKKPAGVAQHGYQLILELRRLHRELDLAVRDAYGWEDLDLGHDFHEVETLPEGDRVRYTISPAARKVVLKRLLDLNHARAAEEKAAGVGKIKGARKKKAGEGTGELFG